jgi:hypothetical protein
MGRRHRSSSGLVRISFSVQIYELILPEGRLSVLEHVVTVQVVGDVALGQDVDVIHVRCWVAHHDEGTVPLYERPSFSMPNDSCLYIKMMK